VIHELKSRFSGLIWEYLKQRDLMGYSVVEDTVKLASFDQFCLERFPNESELTQEIVLEWCNDAKGNGGANRARAIRNLARHVLLTGVDAYVMPPAFFPQQRPKLPVIMNNAEIQRFFEAADRYPGSVRSPLLEYTVPVILRLIFACGMRPQEARQIRCVDFNFSDGTIYIAEGKHNKDRCLPVGPDVMDMCNKYNRIAEIITPNRTYFFQSPRGAAYKPHWLGTVFSRCWKMSGNDIGRGYCTPYALRHNFATQTLMRWVEEGRDLDAMIPYLSSYMGHENFSSTYYYTHLMPDRLARLGFTYADDIIPEVGEYEEEC